MVVNAVPPTGVEFVLESGPNVSWWKGLRVPDGLGSSVLISTDGARRVDRFTLPAQHVTNGQELTFHKAKWFGAKRIVYRLGDLGRLRPGSRATFTWMRD